MGTKVPIHIKFAAAKHTVEVDVESSVKELKESIEGITSVPVAQQRLIFKGRIMKDDNSLKSYG